MATTLVNQKKTHAHTKHVQVLAPGEDDRLLPDLLLVRDVLRTLGLFQGCCERGDGVVVRPALQSCSKKEAVRKGEAEGGSVSRRRETDGEIYERK